MVDKVTPGDGSDMQGLTREQLEGELARAEDELADVDEMRRFTLGQTGVHIGAGRLQSLQATWAREEARLRERIQVIKGLLASQPGHGGIEATSTGRNGT